MTGKEKEKYSNFVYSNEIWIKTQIHLLKRELLLSERKVRPSAYSDKWNSTVRPKDIRLFRHFFLSFLYLTITINNNFFHFYVQIRSKQPIEHTNKMKI